VIAVKESLEDLVHQWEEIEAAEKNQLPRLTLAEAHVKGARLTVVRSTLPFRPLVGLSCRSGADGSRLCRVHQGVLTPYLSRSQMSYRSPGFARCGELASRRV